MKGDPTYYCIGHADQLNDALFHAGKSSVDSGYYRGDYTVNANGTFVAGSGTKHGSMRQWEERDDREIVSGDTVNEWYDTANRLHFYILAKNENPGRIVDGEQQYFLSYTVGMLHDNGLAVDGQLEIIARVVEGESWNRVAVVELDITNKGAAATDIIRVGAFGDFETTLLNDLYAIGLGQTVTVPVYISLTEGFTAADLLGKSIGFTVGSESNAANKASATMGAQNVYKRLLIDVVPVASVKKQNGNKNDLTITVTEKYEDGTKEVITKTFSIDNNAAANYVVGPYKVYVDTKGNDQIRACYVVK
jgi:hypothetical protein